MTLRFRWTRANWTVALVLFIGLGQAANAMAQGTQTSTLSGSVESNDGAVLPGVMVTLSSPSLQGVRTVTTDATGSYIFRGLSGGNYKVMFALPGFGTVERDVAVALGTAPTVNVTLAVANLTEEVTVTG